MLTLLQFFNPRIGEPDPDLTFEINVFIDVILQTECMNTCYSYLQDWGELEQFCEIDVVENTDVIICNKIGRRQRDDMA